MVRFKNRYFLCEIIWEDGSRDTSLTTGDVYTAIRDVVSLNFGDYGMGSVLTSLQSS